jgi:hypothetical protein
MSYLQGTLQLVVDASAASEFQQRLSELGLSGTSKDI